MSSEINVFFRGKLPAKAALTRAMKELGFPFSVAPPAGSLEKQNGFMPMRFRRQETGVEFDVFNGRAAIKDVAGDSFKDVDASFDRSANFRWGGEEAEMLAGLCAAAALAKLVNGIVFEEAEGKLLSVDEAIAFAKKHLDAVKPPDRRRQARLADLKHYLKPLLKQRGDLALIGGRYLFVRPVRHLLRGAGFDRTSFGYFRVWRSVAPLYAPQRGVGDYYDVADCAVWEPHFEPLLIDALAEDVFEKVGPIRTLNDFAAQSGEDDTAFRRGKAVSLVLAGERDRAAAYVERIKNDDRIADDVKDLVGREWDRVSGNIEAICAEFHAREAATVKELKLESIWEPSPFPVELPVAERAARSNEPAFSTAPWISRPPWLWQEAPQQPGEVRFAKDRHRRDGRMILLALMSPEEAERRHHAHESYMLAARLPNGMLLLVMRKGLDRESPFDQGHEPGYRPSISFLIELFASSHAAQLNAKEYSDDENLIELWSVRVFGQYPRRDVWQYQPNLRENTRGIHDHRAGAGEKVYSSMPLPPAERDLVECPMPGFGEYAELVRHIMSLLQCAGYGQLT
jgi:hypothetical protein